MFLPLLASSPRAFFSEKLIVGEDANTGTEPYLHFKKLLLMTIRQAQDTIDAWIHTVGVRYYNELTNTALLMEEVGEMARLLARMYGEQSFKTPTPPEEAQRQLADEMADVLFVLVCLANQTGVDLTDALEKNLEKKTTRDAARHAANEKLR